MPFSDLDLARRLEAAEGRGCMAFAAAHRRLDPSCGAEWLERGGAFAVFDGVDSPVTQSFGLGVFEELTPQTLDEFERFFLDRGAEIDHEVCPLAGVGALRLLAERSYLPIEVSHVVYRDVSAPNTPLPQGVTVRTIDAGEAELWSDVSARGWAHEHPELEDFLRGVGAITAERADSVCFVAEFDGLAGAAGVLTLHDGVALFAGSATVPELRRRGLQAALLAERMRFADERGCDLAMMVAEAGSGSQRNAERKGFRVAYTRTKWRRTTG
ncbi:GNAT family N-acetyltransferase [Antrihabitans sp. YC2-6]|uniref:GNAT family N-acetyltransferase n=1 Tax=Antrihabitans sp. YC2-6 TaxID=2799498 RepID=UPI0018F347E0|nr:GNAT family N-acetyltransferase [Antrihabitans sp. YC2-6]MBJ8348292.1 GNAT family N-acetyltransferase [Antrihabitans sp. YC2-6]